MSQSTPDLHYLHPRLAALYDASCGWSVDRDFYLALAGSTPIRILELGAGTGLLARHYAAQGHTVTASDPAATMLEYGRQQAHGDQVSWLLAGAQHLLPALAGQQFELIIMTGHAFQTLLQPADLQACFGQVRQLLSPQGRFVFESRNPAYDWQSHWDYQHLLEHQGETVSHSRQWQGWQGPILHFDLHYQFPDTTLISHSQLRFWSLAEITQHLQLSGLKTQQVLGDWQGQPFIPSQSLEMIFFLKK